jgi:hypothetical protein
MALEAWWGIAVIELTTGGSVWRSMSSVIRCSFRAFLPVVRRSVFVISAYPSEE